MILPNYPSVFDASNCTLISQLIPPGPKKFLNDFMNGNLFRNPVQQVAEALKGEIGKALSSSDSISESELLAGATAAFGELNKALKSVNGELGAYIAHTDRLSGVDLSPGGILPTVDRIIGVQVTYNSIKDLLKDPRERLEDNFSQAFSSINPQITGPFFENFGQNMNQINSVLSEVEYQLSIGGATAAAEFVGDIRQLTSNIISLESNIRTLIDGDINAYNLALAAIERYAIGNNLLSTALADPCFGARLLKELITTPDASQTLNEIVQENSGITGPPGMPINLIEYIPSLR